MSCVDADDRHFRETALVNETEKCAVSSDAGEKIFITGKLFDYFVAEFFDQWNKPMGASCFAFPSSVAPVALTVLSHVNKFIALD